jgi:anti-sigma-K factor RskA
MSCEERAEKILEYAADGLEVPERDAVARHLATGCPRCAGSLAEAEAALAQLALSLPPVEPAPEARARLFAKVEAALYTAARARSRAAAPVEKEPAPAPRRVPSWHPGIPLALAAGLAAAVTYFGVAHPLSRQLEKAKTEREALATRENALEQGIADRDRRIANLESDAARNTETVQMMRSPSVEVVPLRGSAAQPGASGRIFFDRSRGRWYFHASQLRPAGSGKTYELWFINREQQKLPAGTFDVDQNGEGTLQVDVPQGAGTLALAAVTDEPAGGAPQPTGEIQLAGELATPQP